MRTHILLTVAFCAVACRQSAVIRDQVTVRRKVGPEVWRLEWRAKPLEACMPETEMDITCPCSGFAYGERGILDLVRHPAGGADERLALTPLFHFGESPISGEIPADSTEAVLQRWPVLSADVSARHSDAFGRQMRTRKAVDILKLGDYDHNGEATEFLLQVGALPCGKRETVLVGISASHPALHAFTSVAHPERPLVLEAHIWEALLKSDTVTAVEWPCGDHGGENQTEVRITITSSGFDGVRSEYACDAHDRRAKLLSSERI